MQAKGVGGVGREGWFPAVETMVFPGGESIPASALMNGKGNPFCVRMGHKGLLQQANKRSSIWQVNVCFANTQWIKGAGEQGRRA